MPEHEFSLTDLFPHKNIIVDSVVTREKMGQRKTIFHILIHFLNLCIHSKCGKIRKNSEKLPLRKKFPEDLVTFTKIFIFCAVFVFGHFSCHILHSYN